MLTGAAAGAHRLQRTAEGVFEAFVKQAGAADLYTYALDGGDQRPDPASRFQPDGVHGPSQIVDPDAYRWVHTPWRGPAPRELVIYELHVGTFTAAGTFAAARERLRELRDLGVTAVELMPIADFAGTRNWGYDGVCLYAPSHNYGQGDDLRAFVDAAHGLGLAVVLDVVYNHLGPEGAYLTQFHPDYITTRHDTPWGGAVNLDGDGSALVRQFILDNAVHWVREYRLDGLRLDATHALIDERPVHIVSELAEAVRRAAPWPVSVFAEDHRNLSSMVEPRERGGWGLDGVWADDFHHVMRVTLAGDRHGYYRDYAGTAAELARTIRQGWLFTGQHSAHAGASRGSDPSSIPMSRFVVCLQNHDQIGNRATGDRLHHVVGDELWRAASTVLLTAPMTPLLFMGQEWSASTPFCYFTDLEPALGVLVTEGRRREFGEFPEFADASARERIPDPQAPSTFEASRLRWAERANDRHRHTLALYTELLRLRAAHAALGASHETSGDAVDTDEDTVVITRAAADEVFTVVACFGSRGSTVTLAEPAAALVLSTEDERFAVDPHPVTIRQDDGGTTVTFQRPGAVILQSRALEPGPNDTHSPSA